MADRGTPTSDAVLTRGAHRKQSVASALQGRAGVLAVAVGAAVVGGFGSARGIADDAPKQDDTVALAGSHSAPQKPLIDPDGPVVAVNNAKSTLQQFQKGLATGVQFKNGRLELQRLKLRGLFVKPAHGTYTSGFGMRWGAFHGGIDIAAPLGTPEYATADGVIIDAGPASGFGNWIRLRMNDGTVLVYGHMYKLLVKKGQRVTAGDKIALMGSEGFSTGSHLHFEVWEHGKTKVDPVPWLAARGISVGAR